MSKEAPTPEFNPEDGLKLLEEALSYFTPIPLPPSSTADYEDMPIAA